MKISFCMPCFNKEIYLADAIESVLNQTHKDIELIIVDDKSTDGTADVASWYAKKYKKVKYYRCTKNFGVATCRNLAWSLATGDIICVQDADDLSLNTRAKIMNDYFTAHPETQVIYGSCKLTDTFNRNLGIKEAQDFSVFRLKSDNYIAHPTVAYRRNLPVRYRDGLRYIDDWYFYMDCIKKGIKIEGIIQILSVYRITHDGLTLSKGFVTPKKKRERQELIKEFSDLEEDLSEKLKVNSLQQTRIRAMLRQIPKGSKVVDMGCNGGYIVEKIKKKGCRSSGVEISRYLVDICRKKKLAVIRGNIKTMVLPRIFNRIIFGDVLEHYKPVIVKKILKNAFDGLVRNGKIIITVPHKHGPYAIKNIKEHVKDYELSDFKAMFPENTIKVKYITFKDLAVPIWLLITIDK